MKLLKRLGQYLREVRMELKRVQWPSRREFVVYTGMVIFAVVVFGLLFWGLDTAFLALLRLVISN
ncbi:MAG: preprotein translocase subunit SecE [Dethiobacteria bacterium]|jgi:preprotein translocase subunit SecE|nr:preprotein translocase subunit SecE [Bacillota bacterium]NMD33851.1 preprotein translocase subunit SecE [Bacillota bacterium]HOB29082.1 preprotein translocase subunit SecE [Bacillota bacterium]HPZ41654.1 preprotein translocase subunit SecE [Bacillota bacterium]HQD52292.1 preprotein translocase subunit SecE [Bacillota bacterium]